MNVISWLGAYFVKNEMYEKAVAYFERAAQIQPQEVKWKLMVASCHRRSGDYALAFEIYRAIHAGFPDNIECLRYLVHICDDLGKKDQSHDYVVKLRAVERAMEGGDGPGVNDAQTQHQYQPLQQTQIQQQQRTARAFAGDGGGLVTGFDEIAFEGQAPSAAVTSAGDTGTGAALQYDEEYERQQVNAAAASSKVGPTKKVIAGGGADDDADPQPDARPPAEECVARQAWMKSTTVRSESSLSS